MTTAYKTTAEAADALISDLKGRGYKYQGGYGVDCTRTADISGGRWSSDTEVVDVDWCQPIRTVDRRRVAHGPAVVTVRRYAPQSAGR